MFVFLIAKTLHLLFLEHFLYDDVSLYPNPTAAHARLFDCPTRLEFLSLHFHQVQNLKAIS